MKLHQKINSFLDQQILRKLIFYLIISLSLLLVTFLPIVHDYKAYAVQWLTILNGQDPWIGTLNAYGFIYNGFSLFYVIHEKLPKFIFLLSYFISIHYAIKFIYKHQRHTRSLLFFVLTLNPIFWSFGVYLGNNEVFLSAFVLFAMIMFLEKKSQTSAFSFAIGSAFKYTPIFIIPFLSFYNHRFNRKFVNSFLISIILILISGLLIWGWSFIEAFIFGTNRESKIFSIFRFIRGEFQPLESLGITNLDEYSMFAVILSFICMIFYSLLKNTHFTFNAFMTLSLILLLYLVGHHQFYLTYLMVFIPFYCTFESQIISNKTLVYSIGLFWLWIFSWTIVYTFNWFQHDYYFIREFIGLPTFFIHLFMIIQFFRHNHLFKQYATHP